MNELDTDAVRQALIAHPRFESASAYERTKLCCEILTRQGLQIPSWMGVREHIGKGSANDISRGVKDFRAEHATLLQRMEGTPEGLPPALASAMQSVWQTAITEATALFEGQRAAMEARASAAEQIAQEAVNAQKALEADLALASEKSSAQLATIDHERSRADAEKAAREQAERMAERHIADLTQQRENITKVVEANTAELAEMRKRLDGERRHALMQINEAREKTESVRQEALHQGEMKVAKREAELKREMNEQGLEFFYLQKRYSELEKQAAKLRGLLANGQVIKKIRKPGKPKFSPTPRTRLLGKSKLTARV